MKTTVVVPAYDEADHVAGVVAAARALGNVIVVDDASRDDTAVRAEAAGAMVVRHTVNQGYDGALASGITAALATDTDAVVTLDADGQHVPDAARRLLALLETDVADVAVGVRPEKARWSEHVFAAYTRARFQLRDPLCGMKAYRATIAREHLDALGTPTIGAGLTIAMLAAGARLGSVDIPVRPREGESRFGGGLDANRRILRGLRATIAVECRERRSGG